MATDEQPLRAARMRRGWSQTQAARELADLATHRGVAIATAASLKTQLSRWENGHTLPDGPYRLLLRELYGASEDELGLRPPPREPVATDGRESLDTAFAVAASVDLPALEILRAHSRSLHDLDARLGTAASAAPAHAHLSHLEEVRRHTIDLTVRARVAALVVDAGLLCARIALDHRRPDHAWAHSDAAAAAARESGSGSLVADALLAQSQVLIDVGRVDGALELAERALDTAGTDVGEGSARARWDAGLGTALAATGNGSAARGAFDAADRALSARSMSIDVSYTRIVLQDFDRAALHRQQGHALHLLRDEPSAIDHLSRGLDGGTVRDRADAHLDLAHAYLSVDDPDRSRAHARAARELATASGSQRVLSLLHELAPVRGAAEAGAEAELSVTRRSR